jgi:hypothetical protein
MFVRPAEPTDYQEWLSMRAALWLECPPEEHLTEMRDYTSWRMPGCFRRRP